MHDFRKLIAWQKANALEQRLDPFIERIAAKKPALADQIDRAGGSIGGHISEGCGRETKADFRKYLTGAISSTTEVENHLIRAFQRGYLTEQEFDSLTADATECRKIIHGLRKSLE